MGVTSHWFAFDPAVWSVRPTVDRLRTSGALDEDLSVTADARGLAAVPSWLEANKHWYRNIDGDSAWSAARQHLPPEQRATYDRWFGHLFWDPPADAADTVAEAPLPVAEGELIYPAGLLRHIVALAAPLEPAAEAVRNAFADGAPSWAGYPWMYTGDGFATLVDGWHATLRRVVERHPGWSLLRWVWI